jgi:hypothetical protein
MPIAFVYECKQINFMTSAAVACPCPGLRRAFMKATTHAGQVANELKVQHRLAIMRAFTKTFGGSRHELKRVCRLTFPGSRQALHSMEGCIQLLKAKERYTQPTPLI